jgi:hypothetical protein
VPVRGERESLLGTTRIDGNDDGNVDHPERTPNSPMLPLTFAVPPAPEHPLHPEKLAHIIEGAITHTVSLRTAGLQFGLQFTLIRPGSPEYGKSVWPAARTLMNPSEPAPLKLLIRGSWFGALVPFPPH